MGVYECTVCHDDFKYKSELKTHLQSAHNLLEILCPWCKGDERYFRRAVDLKRHVRESHEDICSERDAIGEPSCFYLAEHPKTYQQVINPMMPDSKSGQFLKRAVEKWIYSVKFPKRTMREWKSWWENQPLVSRSPSPQMDYEDTTGKEMKIHDIKINSTNVLAIIYEEGQRDIRWYEVDIRKEVLNVTRDRERLLRRMWNTVPFQGVVTTPREEVPASQRRFLGDTISAILGIHSEQVICIRYGKGEKYGTKRKMELSPFIMPPPRSPSVPSSTIPLNTLAALAQEIPAHTAIAPPEKVLPDTATLQTAQLITLAAPPQVLPTHIATAPSPMEPPHTATAPPEMVPPHTATLTLQTAPLNTLAALAQVVSPNTATAPPEMVQPHTVTAPPEMVPSHTATATLQTAPLITLAALPQVVPTHIAATPAEIVPPHTATVPLQTAPLAAPPKIVTPSTTDTLTASTAVLPAIVTALPVTPPAPETVKHVKMVTFQNEDSVIPQQPYPEYEPTKITEADEKKIALAKRAEAILQTGGMPLIAPARRNWGDEEVIRLPYGAPRALRRWPPKGWQAHSSDSKLLMWETAATSLAMTHRRGSLDREDILDEYNFLALHGTSNPDLRTTSHHLRYFNFKKLREIALGKVSDISQAAEFMAQQEAAKSVSVTPPTCEDVLRQIEGAEIGIRITK